MVVILRYIPADAGGVAVTLVTVAAAEPEIEGTERAFWMPVCMRPSMVDIKWGIVKATASPTVLRTIAWNCACPVNGVGTVPELVGVGGVTVVGAVGVVDGTTEGSMAGREAW